ncbi:copper homeostasis protein CutC [Atopobiaceae bacterium 24-176]
MSLHAPCRFVTVEVCCGSVADALTAEQGGASRIELNAALPLGGLTPSAVAVEMVRRDTDLEVVAMARPREGGFCYGDGDWAQLLAEVEALLAAGAHGVAFGCLTPDGTVDAARVREVVQLVHGAGATAVFHRAFDLVPDVDKAMAVLADAGVDRVLTSGQAPTAPEGAACLAHLQAEWGGRVEILPGSGVRPENAAALVAETGVSQVHSSCSGAVTEPAAAAAAHGVDFSVPGCGPGRLPAVDPATVRALVEATCV